MERFISRKVYKLTGDELNKIMDVIQEKTDELNEHFREKEDKYKKEIEELKKEKSKTRIVYRKR